MDTEYNNNSSHFHVISCTPTHASPLRRPPGLRVPLRESRQVDLRPCPWVSQVSSENVPWCQKVEERWREQSEKRKGGLVSFFSWLVVNKLKGLSNSLHFLAVDLSFSFLRGSCSYNGQGNQRQLAYLTVITVRRHNHTRIQGRATDLAIMTASQSRTVSRSLYIYKSTIL